ncbi:MAG: UDP-N-acetylmuramate dehydrogenase [Paludibacteraceae bacterium]|nr:UDP-N-acetylmuramate dehydrogenase [Paludibacteraceae bacterium]
MRRETDFSLLKYNTFGIDVRCRDFFEYESVDELADFVASGALEGRRWMQIGGGSNLLFLSDFDGVVLHSKIDGIEIVPADKPNEFFVTAGSGVVWDDFVAFCVDHHLGGVENLSLIPGEVGASPVQNIGAYGVEAKDVIYEVQAMDVTQGKMCRFSNAECQFAYRDSYFKHHTNYIVTRVTVLLHSEEGYQYNVSYGNLLKAIPEEMAFSLSLIRKTIIGVRNSKLPDPKEIGSAGSFFKNPIVERSLYEALSKDYPEMPFYEVPDGMVKIPAGWLIDQCGWKGKQLEHAGVYEKQALVLVNRGGATGQEVWNLAEQIVASVQKKFSITISPEVCVIR